KRKKEKINKKGEDLKRKQIILKNEKNNIINAITAGYNPELFKEKLEGILEEEKRIEYLLQIEEEEKPGKRHGEEIIKISKILKKLSPREFKDFLRDTIKIYHNIPEKQGVIKIFEIYPGKELCYKL
ncbi:MAG: hypothetical protein ABRQ39_26060, partial [Candidatus Eremiobacterota bacterium]